MAGYGGDRKRWSKLVEEALARLTVEDLYGDALKRSGSTYRGPCPIHRGRRSSFAVYNGGASWYCHSDCGKGGDAADFVIEMNLAHDFRGAAMWLAERAGLDIGADGGRSAARSLSRSERAPRVVREQPEPPSYPPIDEVRAVWTAASRVSTYPPAASYLRSDRKRLDPDLIASFDQYPGKRGEREPNYGLLRVLPRSQHFTWQPYWWSKGYRLIAPLVDAIGEVRSLQARNILSDAERRKGPDGEPIAKSVSVSRHTKRGLVLACPRARHVLQTGRPPAHWPLDEPLRFEVAEGELKYTLRACAQHGNPRGPMVFGVVGGAWTEELVARLPDRSRIWITTDQNDGGTAQATKIVRALLAARARGVTVRLRPEFELDLSSGEPVVRLTAAAQARYDAHKLAKKAAKDSEAGQ